MGEYWSLDASDEEQIIFGTEEEVVKVNQNGDEIYRKKIDISPT